MNNTLSRELTTTLNNLRATQAAYTEKLNTHHTNISTYKQIQQDRAYGREVTRVLSAAKQGLHKVQEQTGVEVREFVTDVINKAIQNLFPKENLRISIVANDEKPTKTRARKTSSTPAMVYKRLDLEVAGADGEPMNVAIQVGSGLQDLISFLYRVALISVSSGRKLLVSDELLHGLAVDRFKDIVGILDLFTEEGFQFIIIEHGLDPSLWGGNARVLETVRSNGCSSLVDVTGEYSGGNRVLEELKESVENAVKQAHEAREANPIENSEPIEAKTTPSKPNKPAKTRAVEENPVQEELNMAPPNMFQG